MQDARVYGIDRFFGICPNLSKKELETTIQAVVNDKLVTVENEQFASLTKKGIDYLVNYQGPRPDYFSGMTEQANVQVFEDRLRLLIQTVTNMSVYNQSFLPIIEKPLIQQWVKQQYTSLKDDIEGAEAQLYKELAYLLSQLTEVEAELFTSRLTGGMIIGETREQMAREHKISEQEVDVLLAHVSYYLYDQCKTGRSEYPAMGKCLEGLSSSSLITQSAKRTYQLLGKGLTLENIAAIRKLKISTIQDHVIEAALVVSNFSIRPFINEEDEQAILTAASRLQTRRLKRIYESFQGQFSYFELRLVLSKVQKEPVSHAQF
ncbi:helix-turn-helix domain-containing protein [Halobacillus naozhouensis]|uniref:Helix-turn-helix domain-containing protein n=1 Tax=Halobacillus naozhouensis TaxID=554880 RepID=A0ABY8ITU4_9BACI|nr:helix-turn-helix domain-containing protein [Halobacillus naozhouensis]WFT73132.1 helix-turn-helix domain-containing protein [Halobacillus naozhouensis]